MQSRKFFTLPNVALLIVVMLATVQMGCDWDTEEGQAPRYSYAQPFVFGH